MYQWGPGFGMHFFWMLPFVVIVLVGITALVVWAVRATDRQAYPAGAPSSPTAAPPATARETPLEILARRFASGEITAEEYQRARDLLEGGGKS
jgi:putative membrane protein